MWDFAYGFRTEHDLSQPLLAALWDGFVDIYNELLVMRGAISRASNASPSARSATLRCGSTSPASTASHSRGARGRSTTR